MHWWANDLDPSNPHLCREGLEYLTLRRSFTEPIYTRSVSTFVSHALGVVLIVDISLSGAPCTLMTYDMAGRSKGELLPAGRLTVPCLRSASEAVEIDLPGRVDSPLGASITVVQSGLETQRSRSRTKSPYSVASMVFHFACTQWYEFRTSK